MEPGSYAYPDEVLGKKDSHVASPQLASQQETITCSPTQQVEGSDYTRADDRSDCTSSEEVLFHKVSDDDDGDLIAKRYDLHRIGNPHYKPYDPDGHLSESTRKTNLVTLEPRGTVGPTPTWHGKIWPFSRPPGWMGRGFGEKWSYPPLPTLEETTVNPDPSQPTMTWPTTAIGHVAEYTLNPDSIAVPSLTPATTASSAQALASLGQENNDGHGIIRNGLVNSGSSNAEHPGRSGVKENDNFLPNPHRNGHRRHAPRDYPIADSVWETIVSTPTTYKSSYSGVREGFSNSTTSSASSSTLSRNATSITLASVNPPVVHESILIYHLNAVNGTSHARSSSTTSIDSDTRSLRSVSSLHYLHTITTFVTRTRYKLGTVTPTTTMTMPIPSRHEFESRPVNKGEGLLSAADPLLPPSSPPPPAEPTTSPHLLYTAQDAIAKILPQDSNTTKSTTSNSSVNATVNIQFLGDSPNLSGLTVALKHGLAAFVKALTRTLAITAAFDHSSGGAVYSAQNLSVIDSVTVVAGLPMATS